MIAFLSATFVGTGLFFILSDFLSIADLKAKKAYLNTAKRQANQKSSVDSFLHNLANSLSNYIRLDPFKKEELQMQLKSAGMKISPEMHIANALIKALLCLLLIIPTALILPIMIPIVVLLAVAVYAKQSKSVLLEIAKRRKQIEFELPDFVIYTKNNLQNNRDILEILDSYRENAGDALKNELTITVADMRSGNYESALTRLSTRVGSSLLNRVVNGFFSVLQGDNADSLWAELHRDFSNINKQQLITEAKKVPNKVKKLNFLLLGCFILTYIVVIGLQLITSLGGLFG